MMPSEPNRCIDPAELSAYLDGELSSTRAREIEAALASSPALRDELDQLGESDRRWRAAARTASFRPDIEWRRTPAFKVSVRRSGAAVVLLLIARVLPKLVGTFELNLILNAIALAVALLWIIRAFGRDDGVQST
jgi:anti-sigma factor RsiW